MPNVRRAVVPGDWVFVVSGRVQGVQQYVAGGFQVKEKIDALAAYARFPENRLSRVEGGRVLGNIIVDSEGRHSPLDSHSGFEGRKANYVVGSGPIVLQTEAEIARGRGETVAALEEVFDRAGETVSDVIGRFRRLDERQIERLVEWLRSIKTSPA